MYIQNIKPKSLAQVIFNSVKMMTVVFSVLALSACSTHEKDRYSDICNSRAYLHQGLYDYLSHRFTNRIAVRMGIIPLSVPANLSYRDGEYPGAGTAVALQLQRLFLEEGAVSIVEIFNRQDWPAKREEFNIGNFNAIEYARDAKYDLLLTGYLEEARALDQLTAVVKLIDVENGTTIYYGKTTATSSVPHSDSLLVQSGLAMNRENRALKKFSPNTMLEELGACIHLSIFEEE